MSEVRRQTLAVLVDNEAGVLSQVSRLFSRKGYNIESLAVGTTTNPGVSHRRTHRELGRWKTTPDGKSTATGCLPTSHPAKVTQAWYFLTPSLETEGKVSRLIPVAQGR